MMDIQASSNSITEGRNVTIICNIRSNPVASRTFWLFQDEKILNSPNVLSEGANLFIQGIKRTDAGNYSCQASNIKGTSRAAIQVNVEYAPVCQDIEISAKHRIEHNKDVANVTCNLSSNPGNVTFYWMTRNSSSNHSWSTGRDSYTLLELDENLLEMFCWGENVVGLQKSACTFSFDDTKKAGQDVIFIISFVAILCFIIFLAFFRKLCERDRKDPEVESNEVIGLKDGGCGQMINNCVKSKGTSTKNECLTNLLSSDFSKITIKNKNSSTIPDVSIQTVS
ncbi:ig-like domain-containing protein [Trichonephila clavata]|uniref:Ig-like domain-containing protein n=1 Tax=Trichonephila clavata TaxID=2740835 RepID=A0A8X6GT33_TRICU|nr:ig-like domain-containing protein [Trichonephila clavata]